MKKISSDLISDLYTEKSQEFDDQIQSGRIAAITWLGISRKPSRRVAQYLSQKGYSDTIIKSVLQSLQTDGYINDLIIAQRVVKERQGRKAESRAALKLRMQRLGIADDAIETALPKDDCQDLEAACSLLSAKYTSHLSDLLNAASTDDDAVPSRVAMNLQLKAARFLSGRGFRPAIIMQALRNFFPDIDSLD